MDTVASKIYKRRIRVKKKLLSSVMLALVAVGAEAQSNVSLYGVVDGGLEYTNKAAPTAAGASGDNAFRVTSGNQSGSRWGMRGVEDLGGGLQGIFVLESGYNLDVGTSAQGGPGCSAVQRMWVCGVSTAL